MSDDEISIEIPIFVLYCIVEPVQIIIGFISMCQIRNFHKKNHFSFISLAAQLVFYFASIVFATSRILNSIFVLYGMYARFITYLLMVVSYSIHFFALLLILYSRLKSVFDESVQRLNKTTVYYLRFLLTFLIFQLPLAVVFMLFLPVSTLILYTALMLFLVLATAQCLSWMFVYKLYKINKEIDMVESKLLPTMKKYAILSMISVMFTTIYGIVSIIVSAIGDNSYLSLAILGFILCIDVFVDTICMALSLKSNDRYYRRMCGCFLLSNKAVINQKNIQMNVVSDSKCETAEFTGATSATSH
eukprot:327777_1